MKAAPTMAVKELNKRALTRYLYANGPATKQVLERELGLSLPTITQNLRALEQEGLVGKGEQLGSTGGRKAQTFVFKSRFKAAIGVSMRSNSLNLCAIDLHGGVIARHHTALPYRNTDAYYQKIGGIINDFAEKIERGGTDVLGVAFAIQGILQFSNRLNNNTIFILPDPGLTFLQRTAARRTAPAFIIFMATA